MAKANSGYLFYAVDGSYYAAKARSYLIQKRLPYTECVADRRAFDEVILPRIGFPIIPVLITPDDDVLQDTAVMIDVLEQRYPKHSLVPAEPQLQLIAYVLELYADEWFKIPALHFRWHYDADFAIRMMGENNDPHASLQQQLRVGAKIASQFRAWPQHLGVNTHTVNAVEQLFLNYLKQLNSHFEEHAYILGDEPSLGDCALMGPLYAHIYRDPHSGKIIRELAPKLCAWISRMCRAPSAMNIKSKPKRNYIISPSLLALLRDISRDYVPMIIDALSAADNYLNDVPSLRGPLPRYLGEHKFTLGNGSDFVASGKRSIHSVEIWKAQRLVRRFRRLCADDSHAVLDVAAEIGIGSLLAQQWEHSIVYRDFRFWRDSA